MSTRNIEGTLRRKHKVPRTEEATAPQNGWSIIAQNARLNEILRVPMSFFKNLRRTEELDLKGMTEDDVESLKTADPFLYYSIPGVRAARVALKQVDYSDVDALCASGPETKRQQPLSTKVARRTCVSFECHASVLIDDIIEHMSDEDLATLEEEFDLEDELKFFMQQ